MRPYNNLQPTNLLRNQGVWVNKQVTIARSLYDTLCEEDQREWTKEEILDHINTNGFFASFKLNRISGLIGPSIYTNPPLPEGIGLLPYTTSHSQPAQQYNPRQLGQQQYTLQQNGSTERPREVVIPKEGLDETSKEETIETSDKDETQVDSSRNRQVDSSGNQDQATDQKELNPQDDAAIGPQASKDDPLPSLPTPAQSPEPQSNITTAPSIQAPSAQAPSTQAPSVQAPSVQAPSAQAPSPQAPPVQAPPTQAPSTQAPSPQAPPMQAPPAQAPSTQAPSAQAPSTTTPSAQAPPVQAPPTQAPSVQAPPAQAPSAQALSVQAPLALPSSLTKAKELRQPSSYKPPQPAQQSLPTATASTLPLATVPTLPGLPPAQYLYPSTANTNPNMQLHMDQPTYDPCLPKNETSTKAEQNELHKAKPTAKEPVAWEKEHPSQGVHTTFFTDRRYRQQYQNPPPIPPFRPPVSQKLYRVLEH